MKNGLNHIINIFWTALAFVPVIIYWYHTGINNLFIFSVIISVLSAFIPGTILKKIQFTRNKKTYENSGILFFRKFVQHGDYARKKTGAIIKNRGDVKKYIQTMEMNLRYHLSALVFIFFSMIHALINKELEWAFLFLVINLLYNVYPILLQQYNTIRIKSFLK